MRPVEHWDLSALPSSQTQQETTQLPSPLASSENTVKSSTPKLESALRATEYPSHENETSQGSSRKSEKPSSVDAPNGNEAVRGALDSRLRGTSESETSHKNLASTDDYNGTEAWTGATVPFQSTITHLFAHKYGKLIFIIPILVAVIFSYFDRSSQITREIVNPVSPKAYTKPTAELLDIPIVAIMGETGAGKSSFVEILGGLDSQGMSPKIGHSLESTTKSVVWYLASSSKNQQFYILDTPGFDDTVLSDLEVLDALVHELTHLYAMKKALSGIIYLQAITKVKIGGASHRSLRTFQRLIGDKSMKNVVLATTHWSGEPRLLEREKELKEVFWRGMSARGSRIVQHDGSKSSALSIVDSIIQYKPIVVQIVKELGEGRTLKDTSAGESVSEGLDKLDRQLHAEFESVNEELEELKLKQEQALDLSERDIQRISGEFKTAQEEQKKDAEKALKGAEIKWEAEKARLLETMAAAKLSNEEIDTKLRQYQQTAREERDIETKLWDDRLRKHKEVADRAIQDAQVLLETERAQSAAAVAEAEREKSEVINAINQLKEANEKLKKELDAILSPENRPFGNNEQDMPTKDFKKLHPWSQRGSLPDSKKFLARFFSPQSYLIVDILVILSWVYESLYLLVTFIDTSIDYTKGRTTYNLPVTPLNLQNRSYFIKQMLVVVLAGTWILYSFELFFYASDSLLGLCCFIMGPLINNKIEDHGDPLYTRLVISTFLRALTYLSTGSFNFLVDVLSLGFS